MPIEQAKREKITSALAQMDHQDDAQWTDNGLPRMDVVQRLTGDHTITRPEITEAQPNFERTIVAPDESGEGADGNTIATAQPAAPESGPKAENDGVLSDRRTELKQAIVDAEQAYLANEKILQDAHGARGRLRGVLDTAKKAYMAAFPVITASENIRQHLASELQKRREQVAGLQRMQNGDAPPTTAIDAALQFRPRGNQRGGSPVRRVIGPDGNMHIPVNRKAPPRAGGPVIGSGPVPARAAG